MDDAYRGTFEEAFESLRKRGVVPPSAESAARDRMRACFNHDVACVSPAIARCLYSRCASLRKVYSNPRQVLRSMCAAVQERARSFEDGVLPAHKWSNELPADSDAWMNIRAEELEAHLAEQEAAMAAAQMSADAKGDRKAEAPPSAKDVSQLDELVNRFGAFMSSAADIDGAEVMRCVFRILMGWLAN